MPVRYRHTSQTAGWLLCLALCAAPALAQPQPVAIDLIHTDLGALASGRETPQILASTPLVLMVSGPGDWFVRATTLAATTAAPLGPPVDVIWPPNPCYPPNPCKVLYSEHFLPGHVLVLGDDMGVVAFPISILPDGTPVAGEEICYPPDPIAPDLGPACAVTELPGSPFGDGLARLYVGTQSGVIVRFLGPEVAGLTFDGTIEDLMGQPIADLAPIPQGDGPVLGVSIGAQILGISHPDVSPVVIFDITHPDGHAVVDFVAAQPGPPNSPVFISFCDGMEVRVPRAELPADASGSTLMVLYPPDPILPILTGPPVELAQGSLLLLTAGVPGVFYDPGFDVMGGTSFCIKDLSTSEPATCAECSVGMTGDVNLSGSLTSADIIALVNYVFKSGAPPLPCEAAGDVGCNGTVTSADVIYMVNHVFKGGPPPCDVCAVLAELWGSCS